MNNRNWVEFHWTVSDNYADLERVPFFIVGTRSMKNRTFAKSSRAITIFGDYRSKINGTGKVAIVFCNFVPIFIVFHGLVKCKKTIANTFRINFYRFLKIFLRMVVFQTLLQKSAGPCRQGTHLHTNGTWLLRFLGIEHYEEIISINLADCNFSAKTSLKMNP